MATNTTATATDTTTTAAAPLSSTSTSSDGGGSGGSGCYRDRGVNAFGGGRSLVAVDIGCILVKLVYFGNKPLPDNMPAFICVESTPYVSALTGGVHLAAEGASPDASATTTSCCTAAVPTGNSRTGSQTRFLRFLKFPLENAPQFNEWVIANSLVDLYLEGNRLVNATGMPQLPVATLGVEFQVQDEMQSLIRGLTFLLHHTDDEIFIFNQETMTKEFLPSSSWAPGGKEKMFPYLLVRVGSGVSVFKVSSPTSFARVSGSGIGGGTFWGLCKLLTEAKHYEEARDFCLTGNNRNVDLQVGDIYGCDYGNLGLKSDIIASSFGKVPRMGGDRALYKQEDIARSAMFMVTVNIGQIAFLTAQLEHVKSIFFTGSFLRDNPVVYERLSWAISFWSQKTMNAMFFLHDGYLGSLGALLA
ncbi:pantothenate kinase [Pelomyxa schiedti]|nr:pantothenate kinase [Pelomyxa schiedti]